jgi:hypothetical protein
MLCQKRPRWDYMNPDITKYPTDAPGRYPQGVNE